MFKTCIITSRRPYNTSEIVKKAIEENHWDISTIAYKPDHVHIYFSYKWYQSIKVYIFKKEVKDFEERVKYYDKPDIPGYLFTEKVKHSNNLRKEALTRFAYATVQGDPEGRDGEAITNEDGAVIGYKK